MANNGCLLASLSMVSEAQAFNQDNSTGVLKGHAARNSLFLTFTLGSSALLPLVAFLPQLADRVRGAGQKVPGDSTDRAVGLIG